MKKKVEAILFSSGRKMGLEELSRICGIRDINALKQALAELKKGYDEKDTALKLIEEPDGYKLNVKEEHLALVQKIVTQTELSKTLMETLAIIAWKYPCLQAEVVKVRTNKAYDHLKELEQLSFITREPFGRTKKIRLTEHFFEYFDLPQKAKAQEIFHEKMPQEVQEKVRQTIDEIEKKEEDVEKIKQEIAEQEKLIKEKKAQEEKEEKQDEIKAEMPEMQEPDAVPEPEQQPEKQE